MLDPLPPLGWNLTGEPKGTPETGQGADGAIETAASFANHLKRLVENYTEKIPSLKEIQKCLQEFQMHRQPRALAANLLLMENTRVFTLATPLLKFIIENVAQWLGDVSANKDAGRLIGAEHVESLPISAQSTTGTMPFNATQGIWRAGNAGR